MYKYYNLAGKLLGQMWRTLTNIEKMHYIELAEQDKNRYLKEMDDYNKMQQQYKDNNISICHE